MPDYPMRLSSDKPYSQNQGGNVVRPYLPDNTVHDKVTSPYDAPDTIPCYNAGNACRTSTPHRPVLPFQKPAPRASLHGHGRKPVLCRSSHYLNRSVRRDLDKGLPIEMPRNYYREDNPEKGPLVRWRSVANLLFSNWLNYYVYQETPYDINQIK
jgi:hypothetical protein